MRCTFVVVIAAAGCQDLTIVLDRQFATLRRRGGKASRRQKKKCTKRGGARDPKRKWKLCWAVASLERLISSQPGATTRSIKVEATDQGQDATMLLGSGKTRAEELLPWERWPRIGGAPCRPDPGGYSTRRRRWAWLLVCYWVGAGVGGDRDSVPSLLEDTPYL